MEIGNCLLHLVWVKRLEIWNVKFISLRLDRLCLHKKSITFRLKFVVLLHTSHSLLKFDLRRNLCKQAWPDYRFGCAELDRA